MIEHPDAADPGVVNPFTTLETRPIYENPWIEVREDKILQPDGQPGIYGVVSFKNRAIGVLPVDHQGRIWMVGQYRYPVGAYSWEIPEGGSFPGEEPEQAARRELREETGLAADRLELLLNAHLSNSVSDELATIYRATGLTQGVSEPEGTERIQVRLVEWDDAWRMLVRGEVSDSMTLIALLHEAVRRGQTLSPSSP